MVPSLLLPLYALFDLLNLIGNCSIPRASFIKVARRLLNLVERSLFHQGDVIAPLGLNQMLKSFAPSRILGVLLHCHGFCILALGKSSHGEVRPAAEVG